jgi:hypothetical protein
MDQERNDVWTLNFVEGKNYIGRVKSVRKDGITVSNPTKDDILDSQRITFEPCYDFFSPLRPMMGPPGPDGQPQGMGFTRDPIVTPFDFCLDHVPAHVKTGTVIFFDEMSEDDRKQYMGFIDMTEKQQMAIRAKKRSNLTLVGASGEDLKNPRHQPRR